MYRTDGYISGKLVRFHYFCLDLPHSDGCFVKAYPTEDTKSFLDEKGMSVAFTTAAALVHELMEVRDEKRLRALQEQLANVKLLIIDQLGYVPFTAVGAELLFEVFSRRTSVAPRW